MSENKHSKIGASSTKRWFACPASVPLSKDIPRKSSIYADEGTAAHELAEKCLKEEVNAVKYLGDMIKVGDNIFEVTPEMADAVQVYLEVVRSYCVGAYELNVEQKFVLDDIHPEAFGTNDASIVQLFDKIVVIDYKHGRGIPVEAFENTQALYYALGLIKGFEGYDVEIVIVQPNCDHPQGPVRKWSTTYDRLMEYKQELIEAVKAVEEAEKAKDVYQYAHAGDHCGFCPAKGFCKKLRVDALEAAMVDFDEPIIQGPPDATTLNPEQLSRALVLSDLIEEWIKSVREFAFENMMKGVEVPGFKLVKKKANRKWEDEEKVVAEFEPVWGDLIFDKKLKSPAQLEKLVGKEEAAKFTVIPDTGTAIAPMSDKRPPVANLLEDFTNC